MTDKFILADDGKTPVREPNLLKWAEWFEKAKRHVADDEVGPLRVSTVFLGIDHCFHIASHEPVLWETMIFGASGELDGYQERYTSYEAAVRGHQVALEFAKAALAEPKLP